MLLHGVDIIEIARVDTALARWGERFMWRVFTPGERADCIAPGGYRVASLAVRWAAKEAAAKALGIGLRGLAARRDPVGAAALAGLHEIEVRRGQRGQPELLLHGTAAACGVQLGLRTLVLSLAHERAYALASVIGEAD
jgi:holo-[acyl-carrier protein] synthase